MKKLYRFLILAFFVDVLIIQDLPAVEPFHAELPNGSSLGMSLSELLAVRTNARMNKYSAAGRLATDQVEMSELTRDFDSVGAIWYCFRGGKLGAVTQSVMTTKLPIDHTRNAASNLEEELKTKCTLKRRDQVLRMASGVNAILNVELWEDEARQRNVYFLATSQEITVTIFDPQAFSKEDFFVGLESLKAVEYSTERVRQTLQTSVNNVSPVIDLLEKGAEYNAITSRAPGVPSTSAKQFLETDQRHPVRWVWVAGFVFILTVTVIARFICKSNGRAHK